MIVNVVDAPTILLLALVVEQDGLMTSLFPQKSFVVPQKPNLLQHTFKGHFSAEAHCFPHPGSHSDFWSQEEVQLPFPQKVGPKPQTPPLLQQPRAHGLLGELPFVKQLSKYVSSNSPAKRIGRRILRG